MRRMVWCDLRDRLSAAVLPAVVWSAAAVGVHLSTGVGGFRLLAVMVLAAGLFAYSKIVVHEAGHFLAALVLRVPVSVVQIGGGPVLLQMGRRTRVEICLLPPDGATIIDRAYHRTGSRTRVRLVSLAGPLANAVVGLACLIAAGGFDSGVAVGGFLDGHALEQALLVGAAANLYAAATSLSPRRWIACRDRRVAAPAFG